MSDSFQSILVQAIARQQAAETLLEQSLKALSDARDDLLKCASLLEQHGLDNLPRSDVPISLHRKHRRMGRAPKIDSDAELEAFLLARIHRMTFYELALEVAKVFPEPRRVGKSAIHAWYKRRKARHSGQIVKPDDPE